MGFDNSQARELFSAFGDAEYTMEQVSGPQLPFEFGQDGSMFYLTLPQTAVSEPARAQVRVSAQWDTERSLITYTADVVICIVENDLTTPIVGLPEHISISVTDEPLSITGAFEGIPVDPDEPYSFRVWSEYNHVWIDGNLGMEPPYTTGVIPQSPGHDLIGVTLLQGDHYTERFIPVDIADENGVVPEPVLSFAEGVQTESSLIIAPLDWEHNPIYTRGSLFYAYLDEESYPLLCSQYGPAAWTIECLSGFDPELHYAPDDNNGGVSVFTTEMPDAACDSVYRVTFTLADQTATQDFTVHYLDRALPTDTTIPDTFTLMAGETADMVGRFVSDDPFWSDARFYAQDLGTEDTVYVTRTPGESDDTLRFHGVTPGTYRMLVAIQMENIYTEKRVTVYVTDENGNVPVQEMILSSDGEKTFYYWPGAQVVDGQELIAGQFSTEGFFSAAYVQNYYVFRDLYGGYPQWSAEVISGPQITWHEPDWNSGSNNMYSTLDAFPSEPGDTVLRVTATWGDSTASIDYTLHFVEIARPTAVEFPSEITMRLGETRTISWSYTGGGVLNDVTGYALLPPEIRAEGCLDVEGSGDPWTATALKAGDYTFNLSFVRENVDVMIPVTLHVTVGSENYGLLCLPSGLSYVEDSAFEGVAASRVVVPEGCTGIGSRAFALCPNLTTVYLPSTITYIAPDAFEDSAWDFEFVVSSVNEAMRDYAEPRGIRFRYKN